jgi:hypothetical protein
MLLHANGLDKPWNEVNQPTSEYKHELGEVEFDDLPLPMQCLFNPDEVRQ